jgi:subtilisin family serine protease
MTAAKDFVNNTDFPNDDHEARHGTAVAGIVTRYLSYLNNPSAKSVKITPFKVLNRYGVGTTFNIIKAIDQANKNGANLINCSFAIKKRFLPFYGNAPLQIAIDKAREKGILFITGAGNDDSNIECRPVFPASLPNDNILTVGACQYQNSEQQKASFSNYGKRSVDVFAPGFRIGTTGKENTLVRITGTSFSTPIVTGLAALLAVQMASNAPMNAPSNAPTAPTNDPIDFRLIKKIIMDNADGRLRSESVKGVINCPKALRTL